MKVDIPAGFMYELGKNSLHSLPHKPLQFSMFEILPSDRRSTNSLHTRHMKVLSYMESLTYFHRKESLNFATL